MVRTVLYTIVFLFSFGSALGQKLMYKKFDSQSGLSNPFINTINKGSKGYLFIGTGDGLFRYDGFSFDRFGVSDGMAENIIECSFTDSDGKLWLGHKNGGITLYNGEAFRVLPMAPYTKSKIVGFSEDEAGNVWVASQNEGVLRIDQNYNIWQFKSGFSDFAIHSIEILSENKCVAGSDMGAIWFELPTNKNASIEVVMIDEIPLTNIYSMVRVDGKSQIIATADDEGLFKVTNSQTGVDVKPYMEELELDRFQYYDISISQNGDLWLGTRGESLWQVQFEDSLQEGGSLLNFNESNSLGVDNVKSVYSDNEGNTWVGSFGQGLFKLEQSPISLYTFDKSNNENGIFSIFQDGNDYWLGGFGVLHQTSSNPGYLERSFTDGNGLPLDKITEVIKDEQENLWLGTRSSGVYLKTAGDTIFNKVPLEKDNLSDVVYGLVFFEGKLHVATGSGLFILDDRKVEKQLTVRDGLPHNTVKALAIHDGELWLAAKGSLLSKLSDGELSSVAVPINDRLMEASSIRSSRNGLLLATLGNGVFKFTKDGDWLHFLKADGLYSDYCYSVLEDQKGNIWVGHNGGVSHLTDGKWSVFEETEKLDCTFHPGAIHADAQNNLSFGTDQGLLYYLESRDVPNTVEPNVIIKEVEVSDSLYAFEDGINLKYGSYRLRIDFQGLSFKNPEQVKYSYILEGHDLSWSARSTSRSAVYNRLDPGNYTFKVKAFNSDGIGGENVESFSLFIDKPFWLKWWFFLIVIAVIVFVVRLVIVRRLRFLEDNQQYLQQELKERSKEVLSQKELLEQKNKDITDSIIYAKHIQTAMMPSEGELHACFPESFVFYKPRDIVSGDFYWVKQFTEKIVLACADCTGHGVPGAFMSLISTSLLKEVSNTVDIDSPKKAMSALQKEMRKTLSQDQQNALRDGMDVSMVEIDKKTLEMRVTSARRPVVVYRNGERMVLPGDRLSIGDAVTDDDFEFTEHQIFLNKGDTVYMFSDGLQDQFGGERGKKLKKKGLLNMLEEIHQKDMREQQILISQMFSDWKGRYEQVDDIIMIGVRV